MSRAYEDSRYLARTLAATLLDLEPDRQEELLAYLKEELDRLGICTNGLLASKRPPLNGQATDNGRPVWESLAAQAIDGA
jgi:hypothetical protein